MSSLQSAALSRVKPSATLAVTARARELKREHVRIVQTANQSIALNMLHPYPEVGRRGAPAQAMPGSIAI